jgi:hypothetical protein
MCGRRQPVGRRLALTGPALHSLSVGLGALDEAEAQHGGGGQRQGGAARLRPLLLRHRADHGLLAGGPLLGGGLQARNYVKRCRS